MDLLDYKSRKKNGSFSYQNYTDPNPKPINNPNPEVEIKLQWSIGKRARLAFRSNADSNEREFNSRPRNLFQLFRKLEILRESFTNTAEIIYRCYPVAPSREQPKKTH